MAKNNLFDPKTELKNCTFVKTILMLMVVLYHSMIFWTGNWFSAASPVYASEVLGGISRYLNTFLTQGFAFVSGYIFYYIKCEKNGYSSFGVFIKNKSLRLLVPYAFISLVWVIPIQMIFSDVSLNDIFIKYALGTSPSQLWFLLMLFDTFVISYFLSRFWQKHNFGGLISVGFIYGLGMVGTKIMPNIFMIWKSCTFVYLFWTGFKIRQCCSNPYMQKIRRIPFVIYIAVDILLYATLDYVESMDVTIYSILTNMMRPLVQGFGAFSIFFVLQQLADIVKWDNKIFDGLSRHSMTVYLLHQQLIYCTIYVFNGWFSPYLHCVVNFVFSFVTSFVISIVLTKFKVTRTLIGEK